VTLNKNDLASDLQDAFASMGTAAACASALATAYGDYAADGVFGSSVPTIFGAKVTAMASTLLAAMSNPATGSPANFGAAFASALSAFWALVPVTGGSGSGATGGCLGAAAAGTAIAGVVSNTANSAADAASGIADALDTATKTVTAVLGPPTSGTLPIT